MPKSAQKDNSSPERYTNKIFQTLQLLDEPTRKRLLKYLHSPYFVQSKTMPILCEGLLDDIEKGNSGFDRQHIWQKIFSRQPYDDVNFRKCCSDLLKHTKSFMAHELLSNNPQLQATGSLTYIVDHKIEPLYKSSFKEAKALLASQPHRTSNHFQFLYHIEQQYFSLMEYDVTVDTRANLEEISENLDLFYWIEKLKLCSSALSQQRTGNQKYNIKFGDNIIELLSNYDLDKIPELAIYYYSFLMLKEANNVTYYYKLKRLLDIYGKLIPQQDAIELIDSALHYCTGKINKGNQEFQQEYFDLFEDALKKGIFIVKGSLATWRFNNMVGAALRLGKFDWAENFFEQYHVNLPIETRKNMYAFNLARIYRFQGKYDKVFQLLQNVEYEDTGINLISKAMMIITYYELEEFEALLSFTTSFRTYLTRHKDISVPRRLGYLNLIKYTRRLMRLSPLDKEGAAKLRQEITREKATTVNHEWLLEKVG